MEGYFSILQGLEMGWKGLTTGARGPKIKKKGSQMFKKWVRPKVKSSKMGLSITRHNEVAHPFSRYLAPLGPNIYYYKKCSKIYEIMVLALLGLVTLVCNPGRLRRLQGAHAQTVLLCCEAAIFSVCRNVISCLHLSTFSCIVSFTWIDTAPPLEKKLKIQSAASAASLEGIWEP